MRQRARTVVGVAIAWLVGCSSSTGTSPTGNCGSLSVCCSETTDDAVLCNSIAQAGDPSTCATAEATFCAVSGDGGVLTQCSALDACCARLATLQQRTSCEATVSTGDEASCGTQLDQLSFTGSCTSSSPGSGIPDGGNVPFDSGMGGSGPGSGFDSGGGDFDTGGGDFDSGGGGDFDSGGGGQCVGPGEACTTKDDCCDALTSCTSGTCACGGADEECDDVSCCPGFNCVEVNFDMVCQAESCQESGQPCTAVTDCCADAYLCSEAPDGGAPICWGAGVQ